MWNCERSPNGPSELIPAERADGGEEEAAGVEGIVAKEFPAVAVPLVRAGFSDQVDGCARPVAVDARHCAGLDLHLGNGLRRREERHSEQVGIAVLDAIHRKVVVLLALAVDGRHERLAYGAVIRS